MKRAKFILAAVAVLAIAGGSLAFKAAANRGSFTYYTTNVFNDPAPASNAVLNALPKSTSTSGTKVYWTTIPEEAAPNYSFVIANS